ncbi:MAG: hypothetical protein ACJAQT_000841 [Akkermansiaceae bacterium]
MRDFGDGLFFHQLKLALGGELKWEISVEVLLPDSNAGKKLLFRLLLIGFLQLIDLRNEGLHPFEFALVFRANDFLESPLDHENFARGVLQRGRSNIPDLREKQGGMSGRMRDFFR